MKEIKILGVVMFILMGFINVGFAQKNLPSLKIMTYNIRHASPPTKPDEIDIKAIAEVINKYKPDVVALQEVDVHTGRSGKHLHEAKELGKLTNMQAYFGKAINYSGGEYGIAILSKYAIDSAFTHALPSADSGAERRAVAMAYLNMGGGKKMLFACTHLDAEDKDDSRLMQLKTIHQLLSKTAMPAVLAGDLNAEPGSPVIQFLDEYFTRSCVVSCAPTFPNVHPTITLDYIAYRKNSPFAVISNKVLPESFPSDHLPMMAELKWKVKKK